MAGIPGLKIDLIPQDAKDAAANGKKITAAVIAALDAGAAALRQVLAKPASDFMAAADEPQESGEVVA